MIGRLLSAACVIATLCMSPAVATATTSAAAQVTWHRDGLLTWERSERRPIPPATLHRLIAGLAPEHSKVIASGSAGVLETWVRYAQRDGGPVHRSVLFAKVIRKPTPRIVALGIGSSPLADFEANGIARMASIARSAMEMIATAYTANCAGCGGMTAIGRRAGHGIVAVDPRVIPLGTHLYIPGYGLAVAGDTGGSIIGNRIDLGFDSMRDALEFGRRSVTVYRLK